MSPPRYRSLIKRELGPRYASAFNGVTLRAHDGETEITAPIIAQSHLQGLLEPIAGLGLTLHSLTALERDNAGADEQQHTPLGGVNNHTPATNSKVP